MAVLEDKKKDFKCKIANISPESKKRVVYLNLSGGLAYERELLREWGIWDLELIEVQDREGVRPLWELLEGAQGAVIGYDQITAEVAEHLDGVKILALQSIGYNNIDIQAAAKAGICVTNAPGFCAEEVAVHTVGMAIDLVRKITFLDRSVQRGEWEAIQGYPARRIQGMTFGMVFFGAIPQLMAPILRALGMKLLVYAPTKTAEFLEKFGAQKAETLEELLEGADIVSMHTPLCPQTWHMMGWEQFQRMKRDAFFINTARGAVVDEAALVRALKEGQICAAAVDVIEEGERHAKSEIFGLENAVVTPHAAFFSEESYRAAKRIALEQIVCLLCRQTLPENLVNREFLEQR